MKAPTSRRPTSRNAFTFRTSREKRTGATNFSLIAILLRSRGSSSVSLVVFLLCVDEHQRPVRIAAAVRLFEAGDARRLRARQALVQRVDERELRPGDQQPGERGDAPLERAELVGQPAEERLRLGTERFQHFV